MISRANIIIITLLLTTPAPLSIPAASHYEEKYYIWWQISQICHVYPENWCIPKYMG
jgi:hypothetical protein